jgi:hypothetical protein
MPRRSDAVENLNPIIHIVHKIAVNFVCLMLGEDFIGVLQRMGGYGQELDFGASFAESVRNSLDFGSHVVANMRPRWAILNQCPAGKDKSHPDAIRRRARRRSCLRFSCGRAQLSCRQCGKATSGAMLQKTAAACTAPTD